MLNIKDVPTVTVRTYGQSREKQFFRGWFTKFSKAWGSARAPSARRSSIIIEELFFWGVGA